MTLDAQDKISLSDLRMAKAMQFLKDAHANFKDARHMTAINRSYYAALNAIRAILIVEGANPITHEGAVTMLSLRLIKQSLLPVEIVKKFKLLLSRRTDVDYGDFEAVDAADAEDSVKIAGEIIETVDKARKEIIAGLGN